MKTELNWFYLVIDDNHTNNLFDNLLSYNLNKHFFSNMVLYSYQYLWVTLNDPFFIWMRILIRYSDQIPIKIKYRVLTSGSSATSFGSSCTGWSNGGMYTIPRKIGIVTRTIIGTTMTFNYMGCNLYKFLLLSENTCPSCLLLRTRLTN